MCTLGSNEPFTTNKTGGMPASTVLHFKITASLWYFYYAIYYKPPLILLIANNLNPPFSSLDPPPPLGLSPVSGSRDPNVPAGARPSWTWRWVGQNESAWARWDGHGLTGIPRETGDRQQTFAYMTDNMTLIDKEWNDDWENKSIACQIKAANGKFGLHGNRGHENIRGPFY